ncbi:hypothetical protein GS506_12835 [Rhodococcus hoagii]|nr:hypothetical protein [Prescottella equi]
MKSLRNPIRFHGQYAEGRKFYIPMPFALERDPNVDMKGFRVAGAIFGNTENWEVSVASLRCDPGRHRQVGAGGHRQPVARAVGGREAIGRTATFFTWPGFSHSVTRSMGG